MLWSVVCSRTPRNATPETPSTAVTTTLRPCGAMNHITVRLVDKCGSSVVVISDSSRAKFPLACTLFSGAAARLQHGSKMNDVITCYSQASPQHANPRHDTLREQPNRKRGFPSGPAPECLLSHLGPTSAVQATASAVARVAWQQARLQRQGWQWRHPSHRGRFLHLPWQHPRRRPRWSLHPPRQPSRRMQHGRGLPGPPCRCWFLWSTT